jgi:MFS family permease
VADTRSDHSAPSGGDLLADRSVRFYLVTAGLSSLASFLLGTALAKQIYDVTGSALALGMLGLVEFLPAALLVPITGSVADRFDRRRVVAIGLAGEGICSVLLAWYALSDPTSATPMLVLAFGFGTFRAFVSPAIRSLPPLIGPEGSLPRVIALLAVTWQLGMIVGPASSGFLYDLDTALPYLTAALLFAFGAVGFASLRPARPQHRTPADQRPSLHHAMEGLRLVRRNRVLLGAIALDLFAVLFGGAYALLPAIAEDRLGVGNIGYGWLRAAPGVGAVIVTALLAWRPVQRRIGKVLLTVVAVFGVATVALGLTTTYAVAFAALIVLAGADAVSVFIRSTIVPLATPDAMRGRVMAVENVFIGASNELGAFESGVAAHFLGVATAVVLGGVATCAVVGIWWLGFAELRDIDRFTDLQGHAEE